jgi:hypothetical protein
LVEVGPKVDLQEFNIGGRNGKPRGGGRVIRRLDNARDFFFDFDETRDFDLLDFRDNARDFNDENLWSGRAGGDQEGNK